jgi:cytochrome c
LIWPAAKNSSLVVVPRVTHLKPTKNLTGPSLAGLWGRKAGSLPSFSRYSSALKSAEVVWKDQTLDKWIASPKDLVPNNRMIYPGLPVRKARADLIAFLKKATQPGEQITNRASNDGPGS